MQHDHQVDRQDTQKDLSVDGKATTEERAVASNKVMKLAVAFGASNQSPGHSFNETVWTFMRKLLDLAAETRANMQEKYAWAVRSANRMEEAYQDGPASVQDHFWSFLHGVHLIWFYFGRWVKHERPGAKAQSLVEQWKTRNLSQAERAAWDQIEKLRNEDAHVQPIQARKPEGGHLLKSARTGHLLKSAKTGHLLRSKRKSYRVIQGGTEVELLPLCKAGIRAFEKFVDTFDSV